jgi:transposase
MTDDEWVFFEPFLTGRSEQGGRPARNPRRVLDGVFWIARTGAPWRDLPEELGNWNSVWRQFRRWSASGLWDVLLQALADTGGDAETLQMIDSTIIRAHHCAAGAKGGTIHARFWHRLALHCQGMSANSLDFCRDEPVQDPPARPI